MFLGALAMLAYGVARARRAAHAALLLRGDGHLGDGGAHRNEDGLAVRRLRVHEFSRARSCSGACPSPCRCRGFTWALRRSCLPTRSPARRGWRNRDALVDRARHVAADGVGSRARSVDGGAADAVRPLLDLARERPVLRDAAAQSRRLVRHRAAVRHGRAAAVARARRARRARRAAVRRVRASTSCGRWCSASRRGCGRPRSPRSCWRCCRRRSRCGAARRGPPARERGLSAAGDARPARDRVVVAAHDDRRRRRSKGSSACRVPGPVLLAARHYHHLLDGAVLVRSSRAPGTHRRRARLGSERAAAPLDGARVRVGAVSRDPAACDDRYARRLRRDRGARAICGPDCATRRRCCATGASCSCFRKAIPSSIPPRPMRRREPRDADGLLPFAAGFRTIADAARRARRAQRRVVPVGFRYEPRGKRWRDHRALRSAAPRECRRRDGFQPRCASCRDEGALRHRRRARCADARVRVLGPRSGANVRDAAACRRGAGVGAARARVRRRARASARVAARARTGAGRRDDADARSPPRASFGRRSRRRSRGAPRNARSATRTFPPARARALAAVDVVRDVPVRLRDGASLALDLYRPRDAGDVQHCGVALPLVVAIYGGAWSFGSRAGMARPARRYARARLRRRGRSITGTRRAIVFPCSATTSRMRCARSPRTRTRGTSTRGASRCSGAARARSSRSSPRSARSRCASPPSSRTTRRSISSAAGKIRRGRIPPTFAASWRPISAGRPMRRMRARTARRRRSTARTAGCRPRC